MIPYSMNPMGKSGLPYKRRLLYLESRSGGGEFIDTGIEFDPRTTFRARAVAATVTSARSVIFSSYASGGFACFGAEWGGSANAYKARAYIQTGTIFDIWDGLHADGIPVAIDVGWDPATTTVSFAVDGIDYSSTKSATVSGPSGRSVRMFLDYRSNTSTIANPTRIYSLMLASAGVTCRSFIPVLDRNNIPCMYDEVTKMLFYNAGTGDFNYA